MVRALSDVDGSILDCRKSIEGFDNELLSLHTEIFNRIQEQFSNLDSEIANIIDLFDEFDVSDDKGVWSKEGIAQLGLLAQQYELAQYQIQQYNDEIDELNAQYLAGNYSATEYADRLAELSSAQWDAVKSSESVKDAIIRLNEARVEAQIEGIEKEIDAYRELTGAQIDSLKASKDLHDYEKSIAEKTKAITDIERQLAAMQNDTSAATVAKRRKLEEQLAEAKKDFEEAEYQHSVETQEEALNKQLENYEKERNDEIGKLRESLNDREAILKEAFSTVKENASLIGQEIASIAAGHGIAVSNALISSWQSGESAVAGYGEALSQNTSAFIGSIMDVENEVLNLQAKADSTAGTLAWMLSAKADTLVDELYASYYAEANLGTMTQALHESLINTLERGYDISSLVASVSNVSDALKGVRAEAENARDAIASLNQGGVSSAEEMLKNKKSHTGRTPSGGSSKGVGGGTKLTFASLKSYAKGTRRSEGEVIITGEEGPEAVLPKLKNGQYTVTSEGSQVFTKEQTDMLFRLANGDYEGGMFRFAPMSQQDMMEMCRKASVPEPVVDKRMSAPVNNYFDSMFRIEGDVVDADRITSRMEKAAKRISHNEVVDFIKDLGNSAKYGGSGSAKWGHKIL